LFRRWCQFQFTVFRTIREWEGVCQWHDHVTVRCTRVIPCSVCPCVGQLPVAAQLRTSARPSFSRFFVPRRLVCCGRSRSGCVLVQSSYATRQLEARRADDTAPGNGTCVTGLSAGGCRHELAPTPVDSDGHSSGRWVAAPGASTRATDGPLPPPSRQCGSRGSTPPRPLGVLTLPPPSPGAAACTHAAAIATAALLHVCAAELS